MVLVAGGEDIKKRKKEVYIMFKWALLALLIEVALTIKSACVYLYWKKVGVPVTGVVKEQFDHDNYGFFKRRERYVYYVAYCYNGEEHIGKVQVFERKLKAESSVKMVLDKNALDCPAMTESDYNALWYTLTAHLKGCAVAAVVVVVIFMFIAILQGSFGIFW